MRMKFSCLTASLSIAVIMLTAGCGIKPNKLSPPAGTEDAKFPHTYPDPATDPQ